MLKPCTLLLMKFKLPLCGWSGNPPGAATGNKIEMNPLKKISERDNPTDTRSNFKFKRKIESLNNTHQRIHPALRKDQSISTQTCIKRGQIYS
jgi:hypothetical protein